MPNAPESFEPQLPPVTKSLTGGDNPQTAENTSIGDSVGDSVTQTNLMTLGVGPSTPIAASYLARAHAQAVLFTNAVQQQYQESLTGLSVATESVRRIFNLTTNSD
jgi:hypothetical protein